MIKYLLDSRDSKCIYFDSFHPNAGITYNCDTADTGNENDNQDDTDDNSNDNQDGKYNENIKALQRKLTEKDNEYKKFRKEVEEERANLKKQNNDDGDNKVQKLENSLKELQQQIYNQELDSKYEKIKKKHSKFSETIIKLLIKEKKGNLEEVDEALIKQSRELGLKSTQEPKIDRKVAEKIIKEIKQDTSLDPALKLVKIRGIKASIKK